MNENVQDEMDRIKNIDEPTDSEIESESSMEDMILWTGGFIESVDIKGKLTAGEKIYFNDEVGSCRLRICGFSEEQQEKLRRLKYLDITITKNTPDVNSPDEFFNNCKQFFSISILSCEDLLSMFEIDDDFEDYEDED